MSEIGEIISDIEQRHEKIQQGHNNYIDEVRNIYACVNKNIEDAITTAKDLHFYHYEIEIRINKLAILAQNYFDDETLATVMNSLEYLNKQKTEDIFKIIEEIHLYFDPSESKENANIETLIILKNKDFLIQFIKLVHQRTGKKADRKVLIEQLKIILTGRFGMKFKLAKKIKNAYEYMDLLALAHNFNVEMMNLFGILTNLINIESYFEKCEIIRSCFDDHFNMKISEILEYIKSGDF